MNIATHAFARPTVWTQTGEQLRRLLQPEAKPRRFGLIGFYKPKEAGMLKEVLRFPYPFAGWSLGKTGDGFWWEDAVQTCLVSVGELAASDGSGLLAHFGLDATTSLPAVAWVRRDDELSFVVGRPPHPDAFVSFVYQHLDVSLRITNRDHRPAQVWWLDGHSARKQLVLQPGETAERHSYVSHRWYAWAEATEGTILSEPASLGSITLANPGEAHELVLEPRCVDANGHCAQWKHQGECERNPGYMRGACPRSCPGGCDVWGWLYGVGLARLHEPLACWADAACAIATRE